MTDNKSKASKVKSGATDVTHMYADTPVDLGIGPFVSRVTFGNQGSDGDITPQFQLVMPSNALLSFAQLIVATFAGEAATGRIEGAHRTFITEMSEDPRSVESGKGASET